MDSDSSLDEEHNRGWNQSKQEPIPVRPNVDDNSDVSDEENISRAARSIESPPESPQGTHFESPPASPDPDNKPGTPSPLQSPDDSASYGSQKNDSPPRSPYSFHPRSPKSPSSPRSPSSQFANRSPPSSQERGPRSPPTNYPRSPSPIQSPSSVQSRKSPSVQSPAPRSCGIRSPSPNSNSLRSPSPYRNRSESPGRSQSSPQNVSSPSRFKGRRTPSNSPQSNRSPPPRDCMSDDGRSNISSASSFSSPHNSPPRQSPSRSRTPRPRTPPEREKPQPQGAAPVITSHVEDLSDVSDLESLNSMSDEETEKPPCKENGDVRGGGSVTDSKPPPPPPPQRNNTSTTVLEGDDTEQLDFEAEDKEEGECDVSRTKGPDTEAVLSEDEGELKGDELEEGEITDEGENRPEETEPRPICRFYNRGQCTWGSSCRFVHPGVTDKGNYTMFEMVRPLVPVNGPPPMYGPPMDPYRPIDRPVIPMGPPVYQQPIMSRKEEPAPVVESAWERGLRQAKEMLRKSSKRKETEVDFEEKKMNLSLGQDDLDKENDYYTRPASPVMLDEPDRWGSKAEPEAKRYRTMSDRFDDYGGGAEGIYYPRSTEQVWHQRPHYDESMRAVFSSRGSKYYSGGSREKEYYPTSASSSSKRQKYSQREVIVQRPEKTSWKEDSPPAKPSRYAEARGTGGRGDEWADPWMRKKTSSPLTRKRKASYSSGSSYSSSSSSRSSHSSSSSYSRSRSRSSRSRSLSKPVPVRRLLKPSPPLGRGAKVSMSPALLSEKKVTTERSILMNPPPPSPRGKSKNLVANPSPPVDRPGVPSRMLAHSKAASAVAAAMRSARSRSKSSRSSGSSDSSGSSSDSSETSLSSSSSSRPASPSPPVRQKRIVIDERLALATAMKVKAMDALKLSGQKQQIKLTLKGAGERPTALMPSIGKKRLAESPPMESSPPKAGTKTTPKKAAPSRREELLKQLKAVEDAIARKRSKIS